MRTSKLKQCENKKTFRLSSDSILGLSVNAVLTAIALWNIVSAFLGNITVDSMIARLGTASACVANLFSGHRSIRMLLFVVAVILITAATVIYIHDANNV